MQSLNVLIECYKKLGYENEIILDADPAGYPSNFNNTWMPWLPDDYVPSNKVYFTINGATRKYNFTSILSEDVCDSAEKLDWNQFWDVNAFVNHK